jgi:hypothetical protein
MKLPLALLAALAAQASALPQLQAQEEGGGGGGNDPPSHVEISQAPSDTPEDAGLLITATIHHGSEGPKACRGAPMTVLELPPPGSRHAAERCYDLPDSAGCGVFVAAQADGCEARLFAEPGCQTFVNLAVFMPDPRPVGGLWRSMAVRCGVTPPDPDSLGEPPLAHLITSQTGH